MESKSQERVLKNHWQTVQEDAGPSENHGHGPQCASEVKDRGNLVLRNTLWSFSTGDFGGQMLVRWLGMGRGCVSLHWSTRSTGLRGRGDSFWLLRPWTPQLIRQFPNRCRDTVMHGLEATLIVIRCDFKLFLSWERKTLTKKSLHTYFNISWIETHFLCFVCPSASIL